VDVPRGDAILVVFSGWYGRGAHDGGCLVAIDDDDVVVVVWEDRRIFVGLGMMGLVTGRSLASLPGDCSPADATGP